MRMLAVSCCRLRQQRLLIMFLCARSKRRFLGEVQVIRAFAVRLHQPGIEVRQVQAEAVISHVAISRTR
jgi:hypothetical protein